MSKRSFPLFVLATALFCTTTASAREYRMPAGSQDAASYKSMTCTTDAGVAYTGSCRADGDEVVCLNDVPEDRSFGCVVNRSK